MENYPKLSYEEMAQSMSLLFHFLKANNLFDDWMNRLYEMNTGVYMQFVECGILDMFWMPGMEPGSPDPEGPDWEAINALWQQYLQDMAEPELWVKLKKVQ